MKILVAHALYKGAGFGSVFGSKISVENLKIADLCCCCIIMIASNGILFRHMMVDPFDQFNKKPAKYVNLDCSEFF